MSIESDFQAFVKNTEKRLSELELEIKVMKAHPQAQPMVSGRASHEEMEQLRKRLEELERRVTDAEGPPTEL
jgi:polyhydroxyalkanoate synthesis regulator phasin